MWYVYILECNDKTLYTGITTNLARRVAEHNDSKLGARYTKSRRPVRLVYSTTKRTRSTASKEELRIKKLSRTKKGSLIENFYDRQKTAKPRRLRRTR